MPTATTILALFGSAPANLPRLPAASWVERAVLTTPLPTALVLVGISAALFVTLRAVANASRRPSPLLVRSPMLVAILGPLLAGGVLLLGRAVTTPAEALSAQADSFFRLAIAGNADAVAPTLLPTVTLDVQRTRSARSAADLLDMIAAFPTGPYRLRSFAINEATSFIDSPTAARSQVGLSVTAEERPIPIDSWWLLHWQREDENSPWRLRLIESQHIDGLQ